MCKRKYIAAPFFYNVYHITQFFAESFYQISCFLLGSFQCFYLSFLVIFQHIFVFQLTDMHGMNAFCVYVFDNIIYLFEIS